MKNNEEKNLHSNLQDEEELQSIDRKKRTKHLYRNADKLSEYNQKRADLITLSCEPCDKSCLRCYGPLNSQCSTCSLGSQLKQMAHTNETYCINFSERSSGNAFTNLSTSSFNANSVLLILVPAIVIIMLIIIVFATYRKRKCLLNCRREQNENDIIATYNYDRVALFEDEDNQEEDNDYEQSLQTTVKMYTDDNENGECINN